MEFDELITQEKYERLCAATDELLDHLFDAVAEVVRTGSPDPLFDWLPEQFSRRYTGLFAKQFLIAAVTVTGALDQWNGKSPIVTCTAEAFALSGVIELAKAHVEMQANAKGQQATEEELDFSSFEDQLFPDADYELLFQPEWDGVEDSEVAEYHGMLLRFEDWFTPYAGSEWVHPYCRPE